MLELAHWCSGVVTHHLGEFIVAGKHFEAGLSYYRPGQNLPYHTITAPSVGTASEQARNLWILGYPDCALRQAQQAYELADRQANPGTLGFALVLTALVHQLRREEVACQEKAEAVITLSREKDIADNLLWASCTRGWAIARQGRPEEGVAQLRETTTICKAVGAEIALTQFLALLAEAYLCAGQIAAALITVEEALAMTARNRDRYYDAELHRMRGELLLLNGATEAEAETCFQQAIAIAQQQSARSWELRAATSLARLWQQQGKTAAARQMLAAIYGWFTEGFDTADLQDAKALLEELSSEFNLQVAAVTSADTLKRELSTPTPSIAVLPFVNISNDPNNEYFCDGLAEELLNALSKIEALHVAARTSSFSFKGKETDIREIGQKLNVGAVLEGSVRKAGQRLRITAQLINIADGYHLWSERYDRQMQDIFDIQDEISLAIVDALKVKLLGAEKAAVTKRYTDNLEAYQLYLKGRFHYGKWTEEGLKKSIEFFNQAISQEPNFAPAYAGVVNAYVFLWFYGFTPPDESIPLIKSAAAKAVAIDGDLAESQFAMTRMKFLYEWDWSEADRGFQRTLALNPNHAEAHEQYTIFLAVMGRADEAIAMGRRALGLDPLFLNTSISVGFSMWILGQYERLREHGEKLIEFAPDFFGGYWQIGVECWGTGKYEEAISALQTSVACGANPMVSAYLGYLYGLTGKRDEAQQILHQLQELSAQRHALPFELGMVNVGLGELDRAFALFEQAYEQRAGILIYLKYISAMMPGFRDDPRLTDLLRRIGLPA